jgi:hypothetical protein
MLSMQAIHRWPIAIAALAVVIVILFVFPSRR